MFVNNNGIKETHFVEEKETPLVYAHPVTQFVFVDV